MNFKPTRVFSVLAVGMLVSFHALARPCVEDVCLGDSINVLKGYSYESVESFGRPLSPGKKRTLDAIYPTYPEPLAMPLLQGRFDNRILSALPRVNKACSPRNMIGKTLKRSGVQTQFTVQLDLTGHWKVVGIAQIFPPANRDELRRLNIAFDARYKDYSMNVPNRIAHYLFVPNPGAPNFLLTSPLPDKEAMEKYRRNCGRSGK